MFEFEVFWAYQSTKQIILWDYLKNSKNLRLKGMWSI